jgi:hypothetical protein
VSKIYEEHIAICNKLISTSLDEKIQQPVDHI